MSFISPMSSLHEAARSSLQRRGFAGKDTHHEIPFLNGLVTQSDVVRVLRIGHVLILRFNDRRVNADQS